MKLRKPKTLDDLVYVLACIGSFGAVWVLRIVITQGIKMALDDN